jgi:uncharacterized membrane protein
VKISPGEWARLGALALHAALIAGLCVWCGPVFGLILGLPLVASALGLLRDQVYTAKWTTLFMCFYVGGLLVEAYASPAHRVIGTRLSVLAALDFTCLVLFVRWRRREPPAISARRGSSGAAAR